jgi:predicted  nucleic acid-binding Zn-ribbon protein
MLPEDVEREIDKLKLKRTELASKISIITDFDEKEKLEIELATINSQIRLLDKLRGK